MLDRELLKKIRRIEILTRRQVDETFAGQYQSVFKGRGMEFAEVREYAVGDDVRTIDWNVTARMGHPFVKQFTEERELIVMLLVDMSASGLFGSQGVSKRQVAAELGAIFAFSAIRSGDKVGLILFTDKIELYVPPGKGNRHGLRVIREMLSFRPEGKGTDVGGALDFLSRVQKKKAVVFCISDFFDEGFDNPMLLTSRRHDLVAANIIDPREQSMPDVGLVELEDAETGQAHWVDTSNNAFRRAYKRRAQLRQEKLKTSFARVGVDSLSIEAGQDMTLPVIRFFQERAAKLR
jgi:uncharacterized protein (DUF58 family)